MKQMKIDDGNAVKLKAFIIDRLKIDSVQHQTFKKFQKLIFEHFPTIIGIRFIAQNKIQLLSLQNLVSFSQSKLITNSQKLGASFQILQTLWYLHQKGYFLGNKSLNQCLFNQKQQGKIKIKPYTMLKIKQYQFIQPKKDKNIAKNGIQLCFDFQKLPQPLDIWKWAVFTAQILFQFSLQKYIDKVLSLDKQKIKQFAPQIVNNNNFQNSEGFKDAIIKCLNPIPANRPKISQIILLFKQINIKNSISYTTQSLNNIKNLHNTQQQSIKSQVQIQIIDNILLTDQLKKKLSACYIRFGNKAPKSYRPLYRATRYDFSTRVYYQSCLNKGKLLFIIDTQAYGIICFYLQPILILQEGEGIQGKFISDPQLKSWIYSTKNGESYKLGNKDKAYKAVPGKGPVIGDGDIIIGGHPNRNWCYFPKSYQPGKSKHLIPQTQFIIKNYDVYHVIF